MVMVAAAAAAVWCDLHRPTCNEPNHHVLPPSYQWDVNGNLQNCESTFHFDHFNWLNCYQNVSANANVFLCVCVCVCFFEHHPLLLIAVIFVLSFLRSFSHYYRLSLLKTTRQIYYLQKRRRRTKEKTKTKRKNYYDKQVKGTKTKMRLVIFN